MKNPDQTNSFRTRLDPATIEGVWADHLSGCKRCQLIDLDAVATFGNGCAEGVQYLTVILRKRNPPPKRERVERGKYWASEEEVRRLMRYK
ncbi:MAG: hypothetical protein WC712_13840 [Candidatus Brocadiia bacterium]